jgi:hypothetical protein
VTAIRSWSASDISRLSLFINPTRSMRMPRNEAREHDVQNAYPIVQHARKFIVGFLMVLPVEMSAMADMGSDSYVEWRTRSLAARLASRRHHRGGSISYPASATGARHARSACLIPHHQLRPPRPVTVPTARNFTRITASPV